MTEYTLLSVYYVQALAYPHCLLKPEMTHPCIYRVWFGGETNSNQSHTDAKSQPLLSIMGRSALLGEASGPEKQHPLILVSS